MKPHSDIAWLRFEPVLDVCGQTYYHLGHGGTSVFLNIHRDKTKYTRMMYGSISKTIIQQVSYFRLDSTSTQINFFVLVISK